MDNNSSMAGFAALLDQQFKGFRKGFNQGDTVNARVVRVGEEYVTLDVNAKTVGLLPVADVTDEEGEVTVKRFGSGWAWLVAEKGKLSVVSTANAETPITRAGVTPLLTVDVWEHAYYLDWQNVRADYVKAVVGGHLNWNAASRRFV